MHPDNNCKIKTAGIHNMITFRYNVVEDKISYPVPRLSFPRITSIAENYLP